MQVKVTRKNITQDELAKALSGYIQQEGIIEDIVRLLKKSDDHDHDEKEQAPERYIRQIIKRLQNDFRGLISRLNSNVDKWLGFQEKRKNGLIPFVRRRVKNNPANLTQDQVDELRQLIESHFRLAIGMKMNVQKSVQKQWHKAKIELPENSLETWISQSYVGGRLSEILEHADSYSDMLRLARKTPLSRVDQLAVDAAKANAAKYIVGFGRKLADVAEDTLLQDHKSSIQDVIQRYLSGDLTHTKYNSEGLSPKEVESFSPEKQVRGWRELSTELKNRFKAVDIGRDWDRIAQTEVRYATNLGKIIAIQENGGGNPDEIEVYYHVQKTACKYCKKLYLEPDGTPKIFKLSEILQNVQDTGGMQIGLKASLIGEPGGWVPNAVCHPNGHCTIMRYVPGYPMVAPNKRKDDE